MANFSKLCITDAGKRLLNLKLNAEEELLFTEMVMSERKYDMTVLEELTGLEGIRQRADIRKETRADDTIVVNAVFLNSGLEEGYFANTLGLYACLGKEEPVLFAVAVEQAAAAYMPAKSQTLSGMEFKLKITLENADQVTIRVDQSAMATVGDVLELENRMANHLADLDNPHRVSPAQLGIEEGANHYIHPDTHSAAMIDQDAGHRFVTDAQMQTWNEKQSRTADLRDNIVTFDSEDMANPTGWTEVALISPKEKLSSLTRKFSLIAKNVRYLWKLIGNTPLSIGDGTIIGAINTLNTGLVSIGKTVSMSDFQGGLPATDSYISSFGCVLENNAMYICTISIGGVANKDGGIYMEPYASLGSFTWIGGNGAVTKYFSEGENVGLSAHALFVTGPTGIQKLAIFCNSWSYIPNLTFKIGAVRIS